MGGGVLRGGEGEGVKRFLQQSIKSLDPPLKKFNTFTPNHHSFFQSFTGANSKLLNHHIEPKLESDKHDLAIIHCGTNDLSPRPEKPVLTPAEIVNEIEKIGIKCKSAGINDIIISSIITRKDVDVEVKRISVNTLTKSMCQRNGFKFLSNDNISKSQLWKDGLHLSQRGLNSLANNFIGVINNISP